MRVISQSGNLDYEYSQISIEVLGGKINAHDGSGCFRLARYSTPEKARDEMERLHLTYIKQHTQRTSGGLTVRENYPKVFKFAEDEDG